MPMVKVKGQDKFMQFPDDMSLEDIRRFLVSKFSDRAITNNVLEPAAAIGSGIVAEPVAGLAGIAALPLGVDAAATAVETVRNKLTFEPPSAEGKARLQAVGSALAPIGEALESVSRGAGDFVLDKTGSPAAAALAHSLPTLGLELLGFKGANQLGKAGKLGQQLEFGDIGSQGIGKQRGAIARPLFGEDNRLSNINKGGGMWQAIKNENPDIKESGKIKVYRATVGDEIRPNDYVAANKQISIDHLENLKDRGEGNARIIEMEVSPDELMMANDATEFVFTPKDSPLAANAESIILGGSGDAPKNTMFSREVPTAKSIADLDSSGFDTDFPVTHGSNNGVITHIKSSDIFDGVFGSAGDTSEMGGIPTTFYARKGKIAGEGDVDLDYDAAIKTIKEEFEGIDQDKADAIYELSAEDGNVFESSTNPIEEFGFEDLGEASWRLQNLRGKIAVDQDFDIIAMDDEFGVSYFVPFGSKARRIDAN